MMSSNNFDYSVLDNPPNFEPPPFEFKGCKKRDDVVSPFDLEKIKKFNLPPCPFPEAKKPQQQQQDDDDDDGVNDGGDKGNGSHDSVEPQKPQQIEHDDKIKVKIDVDVDSDNNNDDKSKKVDDKPQGQDNASGNDIKQDDKLEDDKQAVANPDVNVKPQGHDNDNRNADDESKKVNDNPQGQDNTSDNDTKQDGKLEDDKQAVANPDVNVEPQNPQPQEQDDKSDDKKPDVKSDDDDDTQKNDKINVKSGDGNDNNDNDDVPKKVDDKPQGPDPLDNDTKQDVKTDDKQLIANTDVNVEPQNPQPQKQDDKSDDKKPDAKSDDDNDNNDNDDVPKKVDDNVQGPDASDNDTKQDGKIDDDKKAVVNPNVNAEPQNPQHQNHDDKLVVNNSVDNPKEDGKPEEDFVKYLKMLEKPDVDTNKKGLDNLMKSESYPKLWTKKKHRMILVKFLKGNKGSVANELHKKASALLLKLLELTEKERQEKIAEELVKTILDMKAKDAYIDIFGLFELSVMKGKVAQILINDDKNIEFAKKCFGKSKLSINDCYDILNLDKDDAVAMKLMLERMYELVDSQGTEFLEKDGIQKISEFLIKRIEAKAGFFKKFTALFKGDPNKEIIELTKEFYGLLLEKAGFREHDINTFVNKWKVNKNDKPAYDDFCKENYRKLLRGENQKMFIESGGLDLVYNDIKVGDIVEDVWKGPGCEKILGMDFEKAKILLADTTLWGYFKEGVEKSEKDSLLKFKLLYKLVLERKEMDVKDARVLDGLYENSKDGDPEWMQIVKDVITNFKPKGNRTKYEWSVTLTIINGFIQYMPNTLCDKGNFDAIMKSLVKNWDNAPVSNSVEIIKLYVTRSLFDNRTENVLMKLFKKADVPDKKRIISILYDLVVKSESRVKLSFKDLLSVKRDLEGDSLDKMVFILTKADSAENDISTREIMGSFIQEGVDTFASDAMLSVLKVLYKLCQSSPSKMSPPEPQNVCNTLNKVIMKSGDVSIRRMCFLFAAFLANKYPVATIPDEIKDIAVKSAETDNSVPLNAFITVMSAKGLLSPELLDGSLRPVVDRFKIEVLIYILSSANKKSPAVDKSYGFTEALIKRIFSIENFVVKAKGNEKILRLLYEVVRLDKRSEEFVRENGGIRSLVGVGLNELSIKIFKCIVRSEKSVFAFHGYGGVGHIMDLLANRRANRTTSSMINDCGNILLRMCEFDGPCFKIFDRLNTVYEIAMNDPDEKNKVIFSNILARIYYVKLGSLRLSSTTIKELMANPNSPALWKPRLYAALYALYSSGPIQDINLDLLKHYMNNPDVKDIVSEVARVASRGDFKLTFSYYSNFAK